MSDFLKVNYRHKRKSAFTFIGQKYGELLRCAKLGLMHKLHFMIKYKVYKYTGMYQLQYFL